MSEKGFFFAPRQHGDRQVRKLIFRCKNCPNEHASLVTGSREPEFFASKARQSGWRIDERRPGGNVCPDCLAEKSTRGRSSAVKPSLTPMAAPPRVGAAPNAKADAPHPALPMQPADAATPAETAAASPPGPAVRITIRRALEANYLPARQGYRAGWSDKRIAQEAGTETRLVEAIREMAFGPLGPDPEIEAVRESLTGIEIRLRALTAQKGQLQERLASLAEKHHTST